MKRPISILLSLLLLLSGTPAAQAAPEDTWGGPYTGTTAGGTPYCDGLLDASTATLDALDSTNRLGLPAATMQITPNPDGASDAPIVLRHTSTPSLAVPLADARYIRVTYRYSGKTYRGRARLEFEQAKFSLSKPCTVYSLDTITANKTSGVYYLYFDIGDVLHGFSFPGGSIPAFDFYPFGDTPVSSLKSTDLLYITRIDYLGAASTAVKTALANGSLPKKYPVYFESGRADCAGSMDVQFCEIGTTFRLPECSYTREGYTFKGWLSSVGGKRYAAGAYYTPEVRQVNGYDTGSVSFVAEWQKKTETDGNAPVIGTDYSRHCAGTVDGSNAATVIKGEVFDGRNTVHVVPNTSSFSTIGLDTVNWNTLPFDLAKVKYVSVVYYYKTNRTTPSTSLTPVLRLMPGSNKPVSNEISYNATPRTLTANAWAIMNFDISDVTQKLTGSTTILDRTTFYPFGTSFMGYARFLNQGDEIYISRVILQNEVPTGEPFLAEGYFNGYEDGTFRPNDLLTRAEAAAALSRATGTKAAIEASKTTSFSDVPSDAWFLPYVAYLEGKGVLGSGGAFLPNEPILGDELAAWIVRCHSNADGAAASRFSGKTLSRAEAVVLIDMLYKGGTAGDADGLPQDVYSDVDRSVWYYPEIVSASLSRVCCAKDGGSIELDILPTAAAGTGGQDNGYDYAAGAAYIRSLDAITERRIAEIRANNKIPQPKEGGKTYYLSTSEGSASSAGTSVQSPKRIAALEDVSALTLSPGDVVLFKRGDTFRGILQTVAGVTYSAYGTGDKPLIIRNPDAGLADPSRWTQVYANDSTGAKIWKLDTETFQDVGAINYIDKDGNVTVGKKEIPDYKDGNWYISGQANSGNLFDYKKELKRDLAFVQFDPPSKPGQQSNATTGPIYVRCDAGNPGEVFEQIEFNLYGNCIRALSGVTIDNLCIKYFGAHGIGAGTVSDLTVTNCEIGYGGGSIQYYSTSYWSLRYGNGIQIYGGLSNFTIDNCYVYEIYDAGITHQYSGSAGSCLMDTVKYTNNVIERCSYNIEYFISKNSDGTDSVRYMPNVLFADNILRKAGYGWGRQRPESLNSHVKGWNGYNLATDFVITRNIFDRVDANGGASSYMLEVGSSFESSTPYMTDNVFVQVPGRDFIQFVPVGVSKYGTNSEIAAFLEEAGAVGNTWYYVVEDNGDPA